MLYLHSGPQLIRRVKAMFWLCSMHIEDTLPAAEFLRVMTTDDDVEELLASVSQKDGKSGGGLGNTVRHRLGRVPHAHQIQAVNDRADTLFET